MTTGRPRLIVWVVAAIGLAAAGVVVVRLMFQGPAILAPTEVDDRKLREYTGVYQWGPDAFVYLQMWNELSGTNQLVAVDETGELRTLYPTARDQFFAGPGAAVSSAVESRVDFQRGGAGMLVAMTWRREGGPSRAARRVTIEAAEDVQFSNGGVRLGGTLIRPAAAGTFPAVILVHGSGATTREYVLPFARFLVRHGMAVFGFDKRGAGDSSGDWNTASFEDLAGDVVAAFEYLKTRPEIDRAHVGLLGVSQAGWVMPIAAVRAPELAFLISIAGPAVPASETTIDHARREMLAGGMPPDAVEQVAGLMTLQHDYARTGNGWDDYLRRRTALEARMGKAPDTFPGTADHPYWQVIRRLAFYEPAPMLGAMKTPVLALFGELDDNILPDKNKAAWEAALTAGGHPDFTLRVLPKANHLMLEAKTGTNVEMASLSRFVPEYYPTVRDWLAKRIPSLNK